MQYRETDFNFVSRLMEQEGIYYYFRHTDGHNTLVLTDSCSKHVPCPGYEQIAVHPAREAGAAGARAHQQLAVLARDPAGRVRAQGLRPRAAERGPEDAEGACRASTRRAITRSSTIRASTCRRRMESSTRRSGSTSSGRSSRLRTRVTNARGVARRRAVHARRLSARRPEPRAPGRGGELRPRVQRLRGAAGEAAARATSAASPRCPRSSSSGRARTTPKPFVQGPQTAIVVGPAGDEIYTDEYGRVKVQFHWDRLRQERREQLLLDPRLAAVGRQGVGRASRRRASARRSSSTSSKAIPTSRSSPAASTTPRAMPPFGFPAGAVVSGIKSNTHKGARLQRDVDGRHGREGEDHHPRPVRHEHDHRARPDDDRQQQPDDDGRAWTTR